MIKSITSGAIMNYKDRYAVYWMLTPLCILNCGYCFRDCSPSSVASELKESDKERAVRSLYEKLGVRKLTLSGGEPLYIGGVKVKEFSSLIEAIRPFKHPKDKDKNLRIELLTNAVLLEDDVLDKLKGVVDRITITLDTLNEETLTKIGRNFGPYKGYVDRFKKRIRSIHERGFEIKLHSVITPVNYDDLLDLARFVLSFQKECPITKWKFYQYMTYNDPKKDLVYSISDDLYAKKCFEIASLCKGRGIELSFKDNKKMEDSMVNLTHFGRMEAYHEENGIRVKELSRPIWEYSSMEELKKDLKVDSSRFDAFHKLQ